MGMLLRRRNENPEPEEVKREEKKPVKKTVKPEPAKRGRPTKTK